MPQYRVDDPEVRSSVCLIRILGGSQCDQVPCIYRYVRLKFLKTQKGLKARFSPEIGGFGCVSAEKG